MKGDNTFYNTFEVFNNFTFTYNGIKTLLK